jgi:hypothetical protein
LSTQIGIAIGAFILLKHLQAKNVGQFVWEAMADTFKPAVRHFAEAHMNRLQCPVDGLLNAPPVALVDFAIVACAESSHPLDLEQLGERVVAEGYRTRSTNLRRSLGAVLRRDPRFRRDGRDRWTLVPMSIG